MLRDSHSRFLSMIGALLVAGLVLPLLGVGAVLLVVSWLRQRSHKQRFTVGFFHPFCNSGGGGERVLWQYIRSLQATAPSQRVLIYTGDSESAEAIIARTKERFGIEIQPSIEFVRLRWRFLITAEAWPRFTLVGQSLGAVGTLR